MLARAIARCDDEHCAIAFQYFYIQHTILATELQANQKSLYETDIEDLMEVVEE